MILSQWLLPPLFTGIFFALGIVLGFQMLINAFGPSDSGSEWRFERLTGARYAVSVLYFGAFSFIFEYASYQTNNDFAFLNFKLLLLSYVLVFLGKRTAAIIVAICGASFIVLRGFSWEALQYIGLILVVYLLASILITFLQKKRWLLLTWSISIDVLTTLFWFFSKMIGFGTFVEISDKQVWEYVLGFIVTNACLSIGLHQIVKQNDHMMMITQQATIDTTTGLPNHEVFLQEYHQIMKQKVQNPPMTLIALDIDQFKHINDVYGHLVGNKALDAVGKTMINLVDTNTSVRGYRVGGEEFEFIVKKMDDAKVRKLASVLKQRIADTVVIDGDNNLNITISIGIATRTIDDSETDLYERADRMLYISKGRGRNQITTDRDE
ncbi:GGDEF domain-containing protein [Pediococcus claussenii]|uniref:Diguanylate cyclase domain protein n=1 Tax=Pediococcus claussenii (strain ATCC BAA-344 / DSM 14800 / JCM 18046 / KCTC 3811 / LMG 21948 / P06) TaxID=701521 RepID=G8PE99_PEDCP|nr:GGDEF domain-containing protein [Pediococcus claussenii]AEV94360.1 diguanylate cyclase domain protein [Pediococcus claussenii ATCC BAA-344]KRN19378.1 hypothetical protein IV79_GL001429 [Pediococcus claussenii]